MSQIIKAGQLETQTIVFFVFASAAYDLCSQGRRVTVVGQDAVTKTHRGIDQRNSRLVGLGNIVLVVAMNVLV